MTEITEACPFWEAEAEDQDYLQRYPDGYTFFLSTSGCWNKGGRSPRREGRSKPVQPGSS